ncbi:MAG TPA: MBL fold metallo-hydrolase [Bacillales bacterium]|nr:MBL fold metallo-hydrolase [Bacillales bacterium]
MLTNPPHAKVDAVLSNEEVLPDFGGITIISTPGHTPGHISLYLNAEKILIAGDALMVEQGQLMLPDPKSTLDMDLAKQSIKKLTNFDIEKVICYHGGLFESNVNHRVRELAGMAGGVG